MSASLGQCTDHSYSSFQLPLHFDTLDPETQRKVRLRRQPTIVEKAEGKTKVVYDPLRYLDSAAGTTSKKNKKSKK